MTGTCTVVLFLTMLFTPGGEPEALKVAPKLPAGSCPAIKVVLRPTPPTRQAIRFCPIYRGP